MGQLPDKRTRYVKTGRSIPTGIGRTGRRRKPRRSSGYPKTRSKGNAFSDQWVQHLIRRWLTVRYFPVTTTKWLLFRESNFTPCANTIFCPLSVAAILATCQKGKYWACQSLPVLLTYLLGACKYRKT